MSVPIPNDVKSHPSYSDGYFAALHAEPFNTVRAGDEPYCYGFEAGDRARKLFLDNGFTASGGGFSLRLSIPAEQSALNREVSYERAARPC